MTCSTASTSRRRPHLDAKARVHWTLLRVDFFSGHGWTTGSVVPIHPCGAMSEVEATAASTHARIVALEARTSHE